MGSEGLEKQFFFSRKKNCKQLSFASLNQEATEKKKNCILSFYAEGKEQGYSNLLRKGTEVWIFCKNKMHEKRDQADNNVWIQENKVMAVKTRESKKTLA